jgi:hypothetical protein
MRNRAYEKMKVQGIEKKMNEVEVVIVANYRN